MPDYIQDPNNPKKQVAAGIVHPSTSGIPVFDTDVEAQVAKPATGTMTFSKEGNGKIFIYNGTGWKSVALS